MTHDVTLREASDADHPGIPLDAPERREMTLRTLRNALTKTGWSYNDVRMMHGVIAALGRNKKRQ